jgi:hypothetical protein
MILSRKPVVFVALLSFFAVLGLSVSAGAADKQTLTGEVSDAMCGTAHMQGTPAECTRVCTGRGAKYTLVVGEKIYALNTDDKDALATLSQQAGKNATVTGTVNGVAVEVSSVAPAK